MRKSELRRRAMFVFETICRRWWRESSALIERRQTAWAKYKLSERCQQLSPVTSSYQFHLKINCFSVQFTFLQWINSKKAAEYMPTLTRLIQWDTAYGRVQDQDVLSAAHVARLMWPLITRVGSQINNASTAKNVEDKTTTKKSKHSVLRLLPQPRLLTYVE